jgi:hypothetical protein
MPSGRDRSEPTASGPAPSTGGCRCTATPPGCSLPVLAGRPLLREVIESLPAAGRVDVGPPRLPALDVSRHVQNSAPRFGVMLDEPGAPCSPAGSVGTAGATNADARRPLGLSASQRHRSTGPTGPTSPHTPDGGFRGRQRGTAAPGWTGCTYRRHFVRTIVTQFVRSWRAIRWASW